ncbi:MAG: hypothetical protein LBN07_04805 [Christensenellaceae bacterium]|jgi:hypothetical protein|nr:hypothetical protein [Christensenellaceae bacterium]
MLKPIIKNGGRVKETMEPLLFSKDIFSSRLGIMKHKHQKYSALLLKMLRREMVIKYSYPLADAAFSGTPMFPKDWFRD